MQRRLAVSENRCENYRKSLLRLTDETDYFADGIYELSDTMIADETSAIKDNINYLVEALRNTLVNIEHTSEDIYKASNTLEEIEEVANYIAIRHRFINLDSFLSTI